MSKMTIDQPSRHSRSVTAQPIPLAPPVTIPTAVSLAALVIGTALRPRLAPALRRLAPALRKSGDDARVEDLAELGASEEVS